MTVKRSTAVPHGRFLLFCLVSLLWVETVFRIVLGYPFFGVGLFLMPLFTLPVALVMYLVCTLGSPRANRVVTLAVLALVAALFSFQIVCAGIFNGYLFELQSVPKLTKAFQFAADAVHSIWQQLIGLVLTWVPFAAYVWRGETFAPAKRSSWKSRGAAALAIVGVQLIAILITLCARYGGNNPASLYTRRADINAAAETFGLITAERLDAKGVLFHL